MKSPSPQPQGLVKSRERAQSHTINHADCRYRLELRLRLASRPRCPTRDWCKRLPTSPDVSCFKRLGASKLSASGRQRRLRRLAWLSAGSRSAPVNAVDEDNRTPLNAARDDCMTTAERRPLGKLDRLRLLQRQSFDA
uniref:ANK_REP_REGION domain-containing protein n=1 Tax=Macrostomum lignano TaxID=282301 RepID=A0A1I8FEG1_9PLAT